MAVEIAAAYVSLVPSAKGIGAKLGQELGTPLDKAGREAGDRSAKSFGGSFGAGIKKAAAVAGGLLAAKVGVDFLRGAIDAGSDLAETISKANTIFGSASDGIEKWASGAANALGQSKQQALDNAATFGNLFSQLGIGADQTAEMSTAMVGLASDFASFHNADITQVLEAQQAAFRGEYDAVQRFVPTINAAAVEQKALAMTGKATTKELTLQEKALATQALLMEGAGAAAGDFARTSDGLANKQRILSANMEDLKARIGTALIPVMSALTDFALTRLIPGLQLVGEWLGQHLPPLIELGRAAFQAISDWVVANWPQIQATVQAVMDTVRTVIESVTAAITTIWQAWGDNILNFVREMWDIIVARIQAAMDIIRGIIQTVTSLIRGDWSGVWEGIKTTLAGVWDFMVTLIDQALATIKLAVGIGWDAVKGIFSGAWEGIKTLVSNGVNAVVGFIEAIPGRVGAIASGAFDGIKKAFRSAINWIIRAWNGLEFKIPGFDPPGPGPKFGGFTLGVPNIPLLAAGVRNFVGGLAIVGEEGPELMHLARGTDVYSRPETTSILGRGVTIEGNVIMQVDGGSPRALWDEALWRVAG